MTTLAIRQCVAALAHGPLVCDGNHYWFGQRRFNGATVAAARAIQFGEEIDVADEAKRDHALQVKISDEDLATLREMGKEEGRSASNLVWWMIKQAVNAKREKGRRP